MDQKRKPEYDECPLDTKRPKSEVHQNIEDKCLEKALMLPGGKAERNLFSALEKVRQADKTEVCFMPQAVPSIATDATHTGTPPYMDNAIQPSPKDSGVDISSPDRKLDDLGDLSSQESSPRVADPTLHLDVIPKDTTKATLKYAAIGNFPNVSYMKRDGVDPNMNSSDGSCLLNECGSVQRYVKDISPHPSNMETLEPDDEVSNPIRDVPVDMIVLDGSDETEPDRNDSEDSEAIIDPVTGLLTLPPETEEHSTMSQCGGGESLLAVVSDTPSSQAECVVADLSQESQDGLCQDNCTLAELNMSQKSTEGDLRALIATAESKDGELSEFGGYDSESLQNDDLFSVLNEDSLCSLSSSPIKKPSVSSPQVSKCVTCPSLPPNKATLTPSPNSKPAQVTGFMSEFTKFLQTKTDSGPHSPTEKSSKAARPKKSHHKKVHDLKKANLLRNRHSKQNGLKSPKHWRNDSKADVSKRSVSSPQSNTKHLPVTKQQHVTSERRHTSECPSVLPVCGHKAPVRPCRFNVDRYVRQQAKVCRLRESVGRLLRTLFPDLAYPGSAGRALHTVDVLLDQVLCSLRERRRRRNEVIPTDQDTIRDVRVLVCRTPLGCLRHLRKKVCHFLEEVLPDLDLGWPFDRTGEDVEDLIREVIQCNHDDMQCNHSNAEYNHLDTQSSTSLENVDCTTPFDGGFVHRINHSSTHSSDMSEEETV